MCAHFPNDEARPSTGALYLSGGGYVSSVTAHIKHKVIIFLARDPIARVVSECFHKVKEGELEAGDTAEWVLDVGDHDAAMDHVIETMPIFCGFNILDEDFVPPYTLFTDVVPVLATRTRDLADLPRRLIPLGIVTFDKMPHENRGSYPDLKFPKSYVEKMLGTPYTEKFFTGEEIEEMRERWTKTSTFPKKSQPSTRQ
jgi:hypothetical protein